MPNRDRTGPEGQGPMTGRGLGLCRRGLGFRNGFGRSPRRRFIQAETPKLTKEQERKILEAELAELEAEKSDI